MTKSVKCVGCWIERSASVEPWKQPACYTRAPMMRNLAGRLSPKVFQRPIMLPKQLCSTVHTGTISSIQEMMARVAAQSSTGERKRQGLAKGGYIRWKDRDLRKSNKK